MSDWFKENVMVICVAGMALGFILTLFGVFSVIIPDQSPAFLDNTVEFVGEWAYWVFVIGMILFVASVWKFFSVRSKIKKFENFIDVESKAKFLRNYDELEYLAWSLGGEYKVRLSEKKREYRIK